LDRAELGGRPAGQSQRTRDIKARLIRITYGTRPGGGPSGRRTGRFARPEVVARSQPELSVGLPQSPAKGAHGTSWLRGPPRGRAAFLARGPSSLRAPDAAEAARLQALGRAELGVRLDYVSASSGRDAGTNAMRRTTPRRNPRPADEQLGLGVARGTDGGSTVSVAARAGSPRPVPRWAVQPDGRVPRRPGWNVARRSRRSRRIPEGARPMSARRHHGAALPRWSVPATAGTRAARGDSSDEAGSPPTCAPRARGEPGRYGGGARDAQVARRERRNRVSSIPRRPTRGRARI